jgi:hypothetical protein
MLLGGHGAKKAGILSRIADQYSRHMGLEQGVQPCRAGPFFKGHIQTATQAADKLENRFRFRFEDSLHDQLPVRISNRHRTSIPIYLASFMRVLLVGDDANDQTYTKKGRPFTNILTFDSTSVIQLFI